MFTDSEIAYLKSQPLAHLATLAPDGQPDIAPVGFEFDGQFIYIGGHSPDKTRKYRKLRNGKHKVALVADDLESMQPQKPCGVCIYGEAELVERAGRSGMGVYMLITPVVLRSWAVCIPGRDIVGWNESHRSLYIAGRLQS